MEGLTPKQQAILQYIHRTIDEQGYAPSYREIMEHFQLSSLGSVYQYIHTLQRKGAIEKGKRSPRSIKISDDKTEVIQENQQNIPWVGNLSIGYPLELFRQPQIVGVPHHMIYEPENTYLLQVQGNALLSEGLFNGDFLLIESRQEITPGEIVLGLINQTDSILKKYYPEGELIRLLNQNPNSHPMTVRNEHIVIQGVLIGMFRSY